MLDFTRRDLVVKGSAAFAAYAVLHSSRAAQAFPSRPGEVVVPWADPPPPFEDPTVLRQLNWEALDSWITPNDQFFLVNHFNWPVIDASTWTLQIDGLVRNPMTFTLDDLKARQRWEIPVTLECSGNHGFPGFIGAIGNAYWTGAELAPILEEVGILPEGIEVVFWGEDQGTVELHDAIRDVTMTQHFARSMSVADAMFPANILAYEMNGEPLPEKNGFPVRLIAPGWYGIANVKWLKRIEIRDRRFESLLMGRDYVTIREEEHDGETYWAETSVGRMNLKSAPARVTRSEDAYRITGAAWGATPRSPIRRVEVQIDDGPWQRATIDGAEGGEFAWKIWYYDWPNPAPGEHRITSRAHGPGDVIQPAMDDPLIANKHTYWESNGQITRRVMIEG